MRKNIRKISVVLLMLSVILLGEISPNTVTVVNAASKTVKLTCVADTFNQNIATAYNFGGSTQLAVRRCSTISRTYLKWQLVDEDNNKIDTSKIVSATMKLNFSDQSNNYYEQQIGAYPVINSSWVEKENGALVWSNSPSISTTLLSTVTVGGGDSRYSTFGWKEWDVTNFIKGNTNEYVTIALGALNKVGTGETKVFDSRETDNKPYLEIVLADDNSLPFDISNVALSGTTVKDSTAITGITLTKNDSSITGKKCIVAAVYDSNNRLLGIKKVNVDVETLVDGTDNTLNLSIDISGYSKRSMIKVYMLDSMINMKILSLSKIL